MNVNPDLSELRSRLNSMILSPSTVARLIEHARTRFPGFSEAELIDLVITELERDNLRWK